MNFTRNVKPVACPNLAISSREVPDRTGHRQFFRMSRKLMAFRAFNFPDSYRLPRWGVRALGAGVDLYSIQANETTSFPNTRLFLISISRRFPATMFREARIALSRIPDLIAETIDRRGSNRVMPLEFFRSRRRTFLTLQSCSASNA